jgi:hypothetical protein
MSLRYIARRRKVILPAIVCLVFAPLTFLAVPSPFTWMSFAAFLLPLILGVGALACVAVLVRPTLLAITATSRGVAVCFLGLRNDYPWDRIERFVVDRWGSAKGVGLKLQGEGISMTIGMNVFVEPVEIVVEQLNCFRTKLLVAPSNLAIDTDVLSAGVRPPTVRRSFLR